MDLGGGAEVKIKLFQNMVMLHIKLKLMHLQQHGSKYFAHRHILDPGEGQKVKLYLFLKVVILHIKLKLMTLAATW